MGHSEKTDPDDRHRREIGARVCKEFFPVMDTSRLLLAFLAFGAACTTLWAWILATSRSTPQGR